jgi:hypothetical protein
MNEGKLGSRSHALLVMQDFGFDAVEYADGVK